MTINYFLRTGEIISNEAQPLIKLFCFHREDHNTTLISKLYLFLFIYTCIKILLYSVSLNNYTKCFTNIFNGNLEAISDICVYIINFMSLLLFHPFQ